MTSAQDTDMNKTIRYHALVGTGPWQEVLVTRQGRAMSQEATGTTYSKWSEAVRSISEKNRTA